VVKATIQGLVSLRGVKYYAAIRGQKIKTSVSRVKLQ